mmetsp:Transcript_2792/g.7807  ORF Transcript_2792/g.7807 Transcript_2792/m.7807 type:complete len:334 (-) Transcript_2792:359-1360(-)
MPDPIKCTLKSFGTFSTPSFGGVGEPFNDSRQQETRTTGRQFTTNKQRKGQIGDNWNRGQHGKIKEGMIMRLYEGEKYKEMFKIQQEQAAAANKLNLTENGFRYPQKPKKSSGLGAYWGCIGPKHQHMQDFEVVKHGEKPAEVEHELKQMMTAPSKKGYGSTTPGCIFGPGPATGEDGRGRYGGREYKWSADPYDNSRQKEREMAKADAEAIAGRPAYKTMDKSLDFFDSHRRVAASKVYMEEPRVPERPPKESPGKANYVDHGRAFFPAKAPRSGPQATFNKFPVYIEDPLHLKIKAAQEEAAKHKIEGLAPFKPTGNAYSVPCPSIVFNGH